MIKEFGLDNIALIPTGTSTINSRSEVDILCNYDFRHVRIYGGFKRSPVIIANMDSIGTIQMAKTAAERDAMVALRKSYSEKDILAAFIASNVFLDHMFYTVGANDGDIDKIRCVKRLIGHDIPNICLDAANGYTERFLNTLRLVREENPRSVIMAGNVVTGEKTEELIVAGADIVKINISSGHACITKLKTGVFRPVASAIIECSEAAKTAGGYICADGGFKTPGDICKALALGAGFVMTGFMFAGTIECDNNIMYSGLASKDSQDRNNGGIKPYATEEGVTLNIGQKHYSANVVFDDIYGGIRSCCAYLGAKTPLDLTARARCAIIG